MPRETRQERLDRLASLARKDDAALFKGIRDLTDYEKGLVLEANYRRRLMRLGTKYDKQVLSDLETRLKRGESVDSALSAIRYRLAGPMDEEYLKLALDNTKRCMYAGWDAESGNLQTQLDDAYRAEFRAANPEKRRTMAPPTDMRTTERYERWALRPRVEQVLSNREGYCGDFYSVFFGSRRDDIVFFETIRKDMELGYGVRKMVGDVDKALREAPDPKHAEAVAKLYGTRSDELTKGRLENVVRTEVQRAIHKGQVERAKDSGVVVGFRFHCIEDDRVTEVCHSRHGCLIAIDDDEMVERCTPPLHYQCRSTLVPLIKLFWQRYGGDKQAAEDRLVLEAAPDFDWH